ncbi:hypothetical protein D3C73_796290 [compost metagenome]
MESAPAPLKGPCGPERNNGISSASADVSPVEGTLPVISMESRFGPVVAPGGMASEKVLVPACSVTVTVWNDQLLKPSAGPEVLVPVATKGRDCAVPPFTTRLSGRALLLA